MNQRVETVKCWTVDQIGNPYIYGATKKTCTPEYRRARMAQYPKYEDKIINNCPRLKGNATTCYGCKWAVDGKGKDAYDCAQLVRFAMQTIGIVLVSGANPQWLKTSFVQRGEIADMPRNLMCIVYRQDDDGKKHHTGLYLGNGSVIHAKGHDDGVVQERLESVKLTHYGIPAGLYSSAELKAAGVNVEPGKNLPTLRRGSKGEAVIILQQSLNARKYTLEADGIFGEITEETVKKYQKSNNLTVDGIVGPKTWASLGVVDINEPEPQEMEPEPEPTVSVSYTQIETIKLKEIEACLADALSIVRAALGKEGKTNGAD